MEPHVRLTAAAAPSATLTSTAWRCAACGRVHLFEQFVQRPNACVDCTSSALFDALPFASASGGTQAPAP